MDARLEIRLLGEPCFAFDGSEWRFSAPRTLPLLAYLILHAGQEVSRRRLAALLWPDATDETARANLRRHIHETMRALPAIKGVDWIVGAQSTVAWNENAPAWIDIVEFQRLVAASQLSQAVDLYHGELVASCNEDWILGDRSRLQTLAQASLFELTLEARARRHYTQAILYAERMLTLDEWREDALRELIAARYESGDRSAALATYERFVARLDAEMNVEPMPETTALRDAIVSGVPLLAAQPSSSQDLSHEIGPRVAHLPLAGRVDSLDRLRAIWTRAARGTGSVAFVTGEAGIGKSRLAVELAAIVAQQGGRTLVGLTSSPQRTPFQPLVDAIRRGLPYLSDETLDDWWLSTVAALVPEVTSLRPGLAPAEAIDPQLARARLHEGIARIFGSIARTRPLLLVLEDIHWAQADTVEALAFLARRVGGMPLLVVACYRDEHLDAGGALLEMRRALQSERRSHAIPLARLTAPELSQLVHDLPQLSSAPQSFASALFGASEGNPLFATQLIEAFLENGAMPDEGRDGGGLGDTIAARVTHLERETRAVAEVAATIGRDFSIDLVAASGGWDESTVLDAIGQLMDRRLVRETGAPGFEYCFTHALIANAIYEDTDPTIRLKRHRRIARLLERSSVHAGAHRSIAVHYEKAGDRIGAGRAYIAAARAALDVFAAADAIDSAGRALEFVEEDRDRFDALALRLWAYARFGETGQMASDLVELKRIASRLDVDARMSALQLDVLYCNFVCDRKRQRECAEAMLALADETGNSLWRAKALIEIGNCEMLLSNLSEAAVILRQSLEITEPIGARALSSLARHCLTLILLRHGDYAGARKELDAQSIHMKSASVETTERIYYLFDQLSLAELTDDTTQMEQTASEMLALAERIGDLDSAGRAHFALGYALQLRGDHLGMREHCTKSEEAFEIRQHRQRLSTSLANHAELELQIGNIDDAMRLVQRAAKIDMETGSIDGLCSCAIHLCEANLLRGDLDAALVHANDALGYAEKMEERRLGGDAMSFAGAVYCGRGDTERGIALLEQGLAAHRDLEMSAAIGADLCMLIEGLAVAGRTDEARAYAIELARRFEENPKLTHHPTRICFALARNAQAACDHNDAERWMERGRALLRERLASFEDPLDSKRYANLPFNRALERSLVPNG